MINQPYVKKYNSNGEVINPIIAAYMNPFPNRKARSVKKERFHGESKNYHLTIVKTAKFRRRKQKIRLKDGSIKTIHHYDLQ